MVLNYKCPNCAADMVFNATEGCLVCENCDTKKIVSSLEEVGQHNVPSSETEDFKHFNCPSCGAELITDEHTTATFCSFCGSPSLVEDRLSGEIRPSMVIPFKIEKEQAVTQYKVWAKKGLLTPTAFKKAFTLETVMGLYVPFWLYDVGVKAEIAAQGTKTRVTRTSDKEYIYTDHYNITRKARAEYEKIPADASKKMEDRMMDLLEPYDYNDLKPFETAYLSGYLAEKYNYNSNEIADRVETRAKDYIFTACKETMNGYSSMTVTNKQINIIKEEAKYVLFPVWMFTYEFQGKRDTFAINGQTGKLVGKRPVSMGKTIVWFLGLFVITFLISILIGGATI